VVCCGGDGAGVWRWEEGLKEICVEAGTKAGVLEHSGMPPSSRQDAKKRHEAPCRSAPPFASKLAGLRSIVNQGIFNNIINP